MGGGIEERSDEGGTSRPAGPGIFERSEKIRKGEKAAGYIRGGAPNRALQGTQKAGFCPPRSEKIPLTGGAGG